MRFSSLVCGRSSPANDPRPGERETEVTTVESIETSTKGPFALPVVTRGAAVTGTWTAQGTGLSVAYRNRTSIAPMAAVNGSALLPISDVVDVKGFDVLAGIRSWSPPV